MTMTCPGCYRVLRGVLRGGGYGVLPQPQGHKAWGCLQGVPSESVGGGGVPPKYSVTRRCRPRTDSMFYGWYCRWPYNRGGGEGGGGKERREDTSTVTSVRFSGH